MSMKLLGTVAFVSLGALLSTPGCRFDETSGSGDPCGPGHCEGNRYCDAHGCLLPEEPVSVLACGCGFIDPSCGLGHCEDSSYMSGELCGASMTYPPTSPISQVMCSGATMNPDTCSTHGCDDGTGGAGAGSGSGGAGAGSGSGGAGAGSGSGGAGAGSGSGGAGAGSGSGGAGAGSSSSSSSGSSSSGGTGGAGGGSGCMDHTDHHSGGVCDGFSAANGAEVPTPSAALQAWIYGQYWNHMLRNYDQINADEWFGTTFTGLAPTDGLHVCGAKLTATVGNGQTSLDINDNFGLVFVDKQGHQFGPSWGAPLSSYGISGGTSATFTIDIGGLPGTTGADMLAQIESGGFMDFFVQDDTAVDCLDLEVRYCCDGNGTGNGCVPYDTTTTQGVPDDFSSANGPEPSSPSPGLQSYIASVYPDPVVRNYDEIMANRWFGTTFSGLTPKNGGMICGAKLTTRIGQGVSSLQSNDNLGLFFVDKQGNQIGPSWGDFLTSWGVSGGSSATITIDIGALPGGGAMLAQMENGWLDFFLQDDTAVDFMRLDVSYCCPTVIVDPGPTAPTTIPLASQGAQVRKP
ncbi:MAG: hypothetical protein QM820_39470 [Minicystis sp.]